MSVTSSAGSSETKPKYQSSCPYIGMINDPQTHVGVPDTRNCCHLVNPPADITFTHQQGFCLGQKFPECPVYQSSGSEPVPGGIFEGTEANRRGFVLPFMAAAARRTRGKAAKSATTEIATQPISEQMQEVDTKSVTDAEPDLIVDQSLNDEKANSTQQVTKNPATAVAATAAVAVNSAASVVPEFPGNTIEPVISEEGLRRSPNDETLRRFKQVDSVKKDRKGVWVILLVGALVIMLVVAWGAYTRLQNQKHATQAAAEIGYTISLATAVQDMGAAAEAWDAAASTLESQQGTATISVLSTQTAVQVAANARQTAQVATSNAIVAMPTLELTICQNFNDANLQILSGPTFLPVPGTVEYVGMDTPQISWVIQNSGECGWSEILVWSIFDNTIIQPIIKRNGEVVTAVPGRKQAMVAPGEQIEVVLQFPVLGAQKVSGEWVLVVDGISLVPQSHLILKPTNWIIISSLLTAKPTRVVRTPRPGGGGGETNPPPTRP